MSEFLIWYFLTGFAIALLASAIGAKQAPHIPWHAYIVTALIWPYVLYLGSRK